MNALINPFVAASAKGAAWLLVWSWQAAVLLTCVWAGLKIFHVKSPALRHQVWLFALIAVASMPILSGFVQSLPLPQSNNRALTYAVELPRIVVTNDAAPVVQNPSPAASVKRSITKPIILSLSFAVWLWGMCAILMKAAINGLNLHRLRTGARRASLRDLDCDECDCEALRTGRVSIALSDDIRSPILLGVLRPMIVFPADITSWTSPKERRAMLRHELAHVQRRDHFVNLFQTVLGAVFFFHPLARYACRQLTMEREMACDDHVVGSGAEAESYAESIIKAAERSIGAPRGAHQLALFGTRQILERRIEMILNKDRSRLLAGKWRYLILTATLIAMVAWTLLPARLAKPGLAQQAASDLEIRQIVDAEGDKGTNESIDAAYQKARPQPGAASDSADNHTGKDLPPPPPPPPPRGQSEEQILSTLIQEAANSAITRDTSVFERLLADDYIGTGPNGEVVNKAQDIAELKRQDITITKFDIDDFRARIDGNSAVTNFLGTVFFTANGGDSTVQYRYTFSFVKRNGRWQIIATHMSRKQ
jgi:bla regulator protein blaR1